MSEVGLDPWYTYGDERYFNVLNTSSTANSQWDMSMLYDRYYDRSENLPPVTTFDVIEAPEETCADGTALPCDTTDTTGDTTDNTDDTTNDDDTNSAINNPLDDAQSEEEVTRQNALLLFFGIVVVLLVALYFVSKGGEDALAAEVRIEKMWDEQTEAENESFVPELPPLVPPSGQVGEEE